MLDLVEFPADDLGRARHFWERLLGVELDDRTEGEGSGVQTHSGSTELGVHPRGAGPGDRVSLPYFSVADLTAVLERVVELGGEVVHPGERWAICRDSGAARSGSFRRRLHKAGTRQAHLESRGAATFDLDARAPTDARRHIGRGV